jgi:hypothetical protein
VRSNHLECFMDRYAYRDKKVVGVFIVILVDL